MAKDVTKGEAQQKIVSELGKGDKTRDELMNLGLKGLTQKERENRTPGAILNKRKCLFAQAIDDLEKVGRIHIVSDSKDDKVYQLIKKGKSNSAIAKEVKRDEDIKEIVLKLAKTHVPKKELVESTIKEYETTFKSTKEIESVVEQIITDLNDNKIITFKKTKSTPQEIKPMDYLMQLSSFAFVDKSIELIKKCYEKRGYRIIRYENTDGPHDGGIDGIIEIEDELGFYEKIIVQAKHFGSMNEKNPQELRNVKLCEVWEFCGVLSSEESAQKGIFVTNGKYHDNLQGVVEKYKHKGLTFIDGKLFCELAQKHQFALKND